MKNIFEGAKFGDKFVSKDGSQYIFCSFTRSGEDELARLYRQNWGVVIFYLNGSVHSGTEFGKCIDFAIKGCEPINEEELDSLAEEYFDNSGWGADNSHSSYIDGFKDCYRAIKNKLI